MINGVIDLKFAAFEINSATYELTELEINKALFPFFVMATVGALACAYKEYRLENKEDKKNKPKNESNVKKDCKKVGKY